MFFGDEDEAKYALQIGGVIDGLKVSFATGGTLELGERPTIKLKGSNRPITIQPAAGELNTSREKEDLRLTRQAEDLEALTSQMPPAKFGHGKETKYDVSVRDALQLKAEEFETNIPKDALDKIASSIRKDLSLQTDITLEPYSLNVYREGGLFLKHKDTPRGGDVFGTLVVALPSLFEGGELHVMRGSEKCIYFDTESTHQWWEGGNEKKVVWSAFFADVDHEIHKVTGGVRVTLAYLIRHGQGGTLPHQVLTKHQHTTVGHAMQEALKDKAFLRKGGKLGFHCEHFYTASEFADHSSSSLLTEEQLSRLKGRDLIVANAASVLGFTVLLVPFLCYDGDERPRPYEYKLAKFPRKRPCPAQMDPSDVEMFFPLAEEEKGKKDRETWNTWTETYWKSADVWIRRDGYDDECDYYDYPQHIKRQFFGHVEYSGNSMFGNEAEETDFYVHAALLINIPAYSERTIAK